MVRKKQPTEFTVKLPSGKVEIDFNPPWLYNPMPASVILDLARSPSAPTGRIMPTSRSPRATATWTTGPAALPRSGRMAIANRSAKGWHEFWFKSLPPGKTAADVQNFYGGRGKDPFASTARSTTGIWPLEGGLTEYLTYRLKPGRYALFDMWNDEHTGHLHAQDGAVKVVTVR